MQNITWHAICHRAMHVVSGEMVAADALFLSRMQTQLWQIALLWCSLGILGPPGFHLQSHLGCFSQMFDHHCNGFWLHLYAQVTSGWSFAWQRALDIMALDCNSHQPLLVAFKHGWNHLFLGGLDIFLVSKKVLSFLVSLAIGTWCFFCFLCLALEILVPYGDQLHEMAALGQAGIHCHSVATH